MGNCMTCSNEESSSMDFIHQNSKAYGRSSLRQYDSRKRTNEKIKQELHGILLTKREQQVLKRIENDIENNRLRRTEFAN